MNFILETHTVTFTEGVTFITASLAGGHSRTPVVTLVLEESINANFNASTSGITLTQAVIDLSAPAPANLKVNLHAISRIT